MKYAGYDCNPKPMPSEAAIQKLMDLMINEVSKNAEGTAITCSAAVLLEISRFNGIAGTDEEILARYQDFRDAGGAYHLGFDPLT
jgi:hypothetical protein